MHISIVPEENVKHLLDMADGYCQNQFYNRADFDKYLNKADMQHPSTWYGAFENGQLMALLLLKHGYVNKDTVIIAEVQSFISGYGKPLIQTVLDNFRNVWWATSNAFGYEAEKQLVAYYRQFNVKEAYVEHSSWVDGKHQYFFYKAEDEQHENDILKSINKASVNAACANGISIEKIHQIFYETIDDYARLMNIDLSHIELKISRDVEYKTEFGDGCFIAYVYNDTLVVNPEIRQTYEACGMSYTIEEFTKLMIARALAHEIYGKEWLADVKFVQDILLQAADEDFDTEYLDSVPIENIARETFCEYLAYYVLKNGMKLSLISESKQKKNQ